MSYRRKYLRPKLRKLRPKKKFLERPVFWIIIGFLIFSTIGYFVLFFQKFQVTGIIVLGNEKVQGKDIEDLTWLQVNKKILGLGNFSISTKSIFFVNSKNLTNQILKQFPAVKEAIVKKKLPNQITLQIKERQPFAIFCQKVNNCFFIDEEGVVFENLEDNPQDMIIIEKESEEVKDTILGQNVIDKNIINLISSVRKDLQNNFQITIKKALVSEFLVIDTSENWQVYLDPNSDINMQITKMNLLLKDEIPVEERKNLQYIYLQYKDRAYYK